MDCDSPIYGKTERMAHQDCEFVFLLRSFIPFLNINGLELSPNDRFPNVICASVLGLFLEILGYGFSLGYHYMR